MGEMVWRKWRILYKGFYSNRGEEKMMDLVFVMMLTPTYWIVNICVLIILIVNIVNLNKEIKG